MGDIFVDVIVVAILLLIPAWRIFGKAGFNPALALVVFVPVAGPLIAILILAAADWPRNKTAVNPGQGEV